MFLTHIALDTSTLQWEAPFKADRHNITYNNTILLRHMFVFLARINIYLKKLLWSNKENF
jgi:hypothetical protein